jgi:hypothetical protein
MIFAMELDPFKKIHQTLRVTMEAGISNHVWTLEGIVNLLN